MNQTANLPLKEMGAYKDLLRQLFFSDELIRTLVMPPSGDNTPASQELWLTQHCIDVPFLDEEMKEQRSLLLIECTPTSDRALTGYSLTVSVCCHKNLINLPPQTRTDYETQYGLAGNLVDMITMAVIAALSNDSVSRRFGVGRLQLASEKPVTAFQPNPLFYGKTLTFHIFEMRKR